MLQTLNSRLEKIMPLITPSSVVIGVLFAEYLKDFAVLVPWIFAFITFAGSLSSNFSSLKKAFLQPLPLILALLVLHVMMPVWAYGIGHLIFNDDKLTITGLILGVVIPTGVSSFMWVSMYKGNIGLALSIILIDTILSPFIVPSSLSILVGEKVEMDVKNMMIGLFFMIVVPSLIGMVCNHVSKGKVKESLGVPLAPFSKIALALVVAINGSYIAPFLKNINLKLIGIILTVLFIAFCGYCFAWFLAKCLTKDRGTTITLIFTGGMRNISAGAVIAIQFFPPAVAIPVVVGMLFQQVLASVFGILFTRREEKVHSII
ncbi:bile acid:sodium symporter family protein [Metabacillus fastidiosus]|uniref:bile acid:sodium symporter family protein n=1 Tax=Metabacillus fastidiosus TaxID=1458 RepID=UPI002E1C26A0|nr:bile acid:sodium symporter family protein [Metabacillus fastidiosus]